MATDFTDINLTTSLAGYFANSLVDTGYQIYWQGTNIQSGTGNLGTVTMVPEMPNEPELIVMPPRPNKAQQEVVTPVFAIHIVDQPQEEIRYGLGDDLFKNRVNLIIEGFVPDKSAHMVFATLIRNYFRPEFRIPIWDWEHNPTTPDLIDNINTYVDHRQVDRMEFTDLPQPVRYYINVMVALVFFD